MPMYESFWVPSHAYGPCVRETKAPDCILSTYIDQRQTATASEHHSAHVVARGDAAAASSPGWLSNVEDLRLHDATLSGFQSTDAYTTLPSGQEPRAAGQQGGCVLNLSADTYNRLHVRGFFKSSNRAVQPALFDACLTKTGPWDAGIDTSIGGSTSFYTKVSSLQLSYRDRVRDQLLAVRPSPQSTPPTAGYRDSLGFIVDYRDGKPSSLGEATYYTALAVVAFATFQFDPDKWATARANAAMLELLSTLIEKGWGNEDSKGQKHPIRYPQEFDYNKSGQIIRARPLTKDSYGQIIAATHYARVCSNTSQEVKDKALQLLQMWIEYLSTNQWRTHSNYLVDEFSTEKVNGVYVQKNIFGKGGARAEPIGIESYLLQPHDIYALKNSVAKLFPTISWSVWENISSEISQAIVDVAAPYLGGLAGRAIDVVLEQLAFSINYDIPLGAAGWNFGKVKGVFSISIPADVRAKAAQVFTETVTDAVKEGARASNPANQQHLAEVVVNRILGLLPPVFAVDAWKEVIGDLTLQVMPWVTGDVYMEVATFIATLSLLRTKPKPYIVSYTSWVYIVECESRRDTMTLLGPFMSDFFLFLKDNGNPNGFWAWLSGDQDEVNRQLGIFESSNENQWWQFAYGPTKFNEWLTDSRNQDPHDLERSSSRLDYLLLEGLARKGRPKGLPMAELDLRHFVAFAKNALDAFRRSVQRAFDEAGQYARQWIDREGRTIVEIWTKPGNYLQSIFESGRRISTLLDTAGQGVQRWLWNANWSLHEHAKWFTDAITDSSLAERTLRSVDGQLERWLWAADGAFKSYNKWWKSSADGAAGPSEAVEALVRGAQGELEAWHWTTGGVFQTYTRWWKSNVNGAAEASDVVESRVRNIAFQLEKLTWATNGALENYVKWWTSGVDGAAKSENVIEYQVRDVAGKLERTIWGVGKVFQSYDVWWRSSLGGIAKADDNIESQIRSVTGELQITIWKVSGAFESYAKWWKSTTGGAASASDLVEYKARSAAGELEETIWAVGKVFQSYGRWKNSTAQGGADASDMVEKRLRSAGGQLEKWLWTNGVFQKYWFWSKSLADGSATADYIAKRFTQLADGSRVVETWDSSRKYAKTVFDSLGRVISGVRIPFPRWPPKW